MRTNRHIKNKIKVLNLHALRYFKIFLKFKCSYTMRLDNILYTMRLDNILESKQVV